MHPVDLNLSCNKSRLFKMIITEQPCGKHSINANYNKKLVAFSQQLHYMYKHKIQRQKIYRFHSVMYQRMGIDFVNTVVNPTFVHKAIFIVFNAT